MSGEGVVETVYHFIKGFGEQIAKNPLFGAVSEDFIKALYSAASVYDFGVFKFRFSRKVVEEIAADQRGVQPPFPSLGDHNVLQMVLGEILPQIMPHQISRGKVPIPVQNPSPPFSCSSGRTPSAGTGYRISRGAFKKRSPPGGGRSG